jgi:hypothetical protein
MFCIEGDDPPTTEAAFILPENQLQKSPDEVFLLAEEPKNPLHAFTVDFEWGLLAISIFLSVITGILIAIVYTHAESMALGRGPWWFRKICMYFLK